MLGTADGWLCRRRRDYRADAEVWSFRQRWPAEKDRLKIELSARRFFFGLLTRITLVDGEEIDLWSAGDALVLEALSIVLAEASAGRGPLHPRRGPWRRQGGGAAGPGGVGRGRRSAQDGAFGRRIPSVALASITVIRAHVTVRSNKASRP